MNRAYTPENTPSVDPLMRGNGQTYQPDPREEEDEFSLIRFLLVLWQRRWVLFPVAFLIIAAGTLHILQLEKRYTATTSLMIVLPETQVVDIESVAGGKSGYIDWWGTEGEIEVIRSRDLAFKLVDRLNLTEHKAFNPEPAEPGALDFLKPGQYIPREWKEGLGLVEPPSSEPLDETGKAAAKRSGVADALTGGLDVEAVRNTNVVNVSFTSNDPVLAARVSNELAEIYILDQLEANFEATRKATEWLDDQLVDLKEKVAASERAVEDYRQTHDLTEVKDTGILEEQLSSVNAQLVAARAERAEAEARFQQVRRVLQVGGAALETVPEVLDSKLIQDLRQQETRVLREISELQTEYGPKHPKMLQAQAEVRDLQKIITAEIGKIATGLENELEVARSREQSLESSLSDLTGRTSGQKEVSIQLRALEREASANRALFETFLNRFKETSSTQGIEKTDARIISRAEVPTAPSYPNKRRMLALLIAGAFFLSALLVYLLESLRSGLYSPEQVEDETGLPVLGMIPKVSGKTPYEHVLSKPRSNYSEALNSLKTSLLISSPDKPVRAIQVTSSVPQEGKSTLALSLARLLAKSGQKIVLVDGDLRRGTLAAKLGIDASESKGMTDFVLAGDEEVGSFLVKDEASGLYLMNKGAAEFVNATDILSSHRMEEIIEKLKRQFDFVIIDAPPIMVVSDARIIGQLVDETVFVVRWDKTPRNVVRAALRQFRDARSEITGVVLQQVNLNKSSSYGYGQYGSGHYYHHARYHNYYSR